MAHRHMCFDYFLINVVQIAFTSKDKATFIIKMNIPKIFIEYQLFLMINFRMIVNYTTVKKTHAFLLEELGKYSL